MIPSDTELTHFIELYSTKHFTRAAIKLGVTQPSLTQSIFRLESKLKTKLFHRSKSGCIPTNAAGLLYDKALQLKGLWGEISEQVAHEQQSLTGLFRVGCHQSVGSYTLPNFFKALATRAPEVKINLTHDWSRKITERVINYELDLAFVVNPAKHRDLVLIKLGTDRVAFWKAKGTKVPKTLFSDVSLFQLHERLKKQSIAKFQDWNIVETSSLELIRTLTSKGAGIGLLPERIAKAENSQLEIFDEKLPSRNDEIFLVYRTETLQSAAGKALIMAGKECLLN